MNKAEKERQVEELKDLIVGKQTVLLTDYRGMTVGEMFDFRRACDQEGVGYRVVKNTLAKRAIEGTDYDLLVEALEGPVGVVYSDDAVAPAKVLAKFLKECQNLVVKIGYLDGKKLESRDIDALSKLPSKDELRAQLLSVMNAPATKFVGVLAAGPRSFVQVLSARQNAL
jgi:large subunit ribosomal protein L10